jgi:lipoate-protein ligase A
MRYLDWTYPQIAENLALDEALLQEAEDEGTGPVLRVWEFPSFAVVLGASGKLREDVHVDSCETDGVVVARRSSGGGTVVIGPGALNMTVVLPIEGDASFKAVDTAQAYVLGRTASALRELEFAVDVKGSGDLTLGPQKFAGSAQRRLRKFFLVHASILYRFPLAHLARYTTNPRRQPAYREGRAHGDFVINLDQPRDQILEAVRSAWLPPGRPSEHAVIPESRVRELVAAKFGDPAWTERL